MSFIIHCVSGPNAGRAVSKTTYDQAQTVKDEFEAKGNSVEVRPVDNSRDWNDRSDPVVRQEEQDEHDAMEGRWERD